MNTSRIARPGESCDPVLFFDAFARIGLTRKSICRTVLSTKSMKGSP